MTNKGAESRSDRCWWIIGAIATAHVDALTRQGSFGDDVRATLTGAIDNVGRSTPAQGSLVSVLVAFDEHVDSLAPVQLKGVASMGRGTAEVGHAVARIVIREELAATSAAVLDLSDALLRTAGAHVVTMAPMWSRTQPVQPTSLAGLLSAPIGGLSRALDAVDFTQGLVNQSPLGAGVGASTRFAPDRDELARALGFDKPVGSVFDAVSATDYLVASVSSIEGVADAAAGALRLLEQLLVTQPDALVFPEEASGRLPDVPQLRQPRQLESGFTDWRRVRRAVDGVRNWASSVPFGPHIELDEPVDLILDAAGATRSLVRELEGLFQGGFEINRAVLGNRVGKGHLTSSDIVDFLVVEEGITPADAQIIAARVLAHLKVNGLEIAAIDREMIDAAGLLVVGREIGIEFETLSKYLAPRRFLEGRTADGAPAPAAMRDWITHETAMVKRRRTAIAALQERWEQALLRVGAVSEETVS